MPARRTLLIGSILAATLALAGCAGEPGAPTGASTSTAATTPPPTTIPPTPEPTAVDPLETVVALVARPTVLELRSADAAVVAEIDYLEEPTEAIATLTSLFGSDPVDETYAATNHSPGGILHTWGAFTLDERHYDEAKRAENEATDGEFLPYVAVYFDAADNGEIALTTVQGYSAGDDWATVSAAADVTANPSLCTGPAAELADDPGSETQLAVELAHEEGGESVLFISAPVPFYTDGCV
ncbi:hypothetical protein [Orlajensenia leifsoniae]|uniref:Uncharacterized protein n=1 Tax=Orlajensenia leifsoniae TaxID=2561933 RepID=A0A4Y9QXA9_9MICO|nr:hypothetical protein [Leifsonia flava]TFV96352.1 hypothetical protein E4M00_13565 [Leifsonia flava]